MKNPELDLLRAETKSFQPGWQPCNDTLNKSFGTASERQLEKALIAREQFWPA